MLLFYCGKCVGIAWGSDPFAKGSDPYEREETYEDKKKDFR